MRSKLPAATDTKQALYSNTMFYEANKWMRGHQKLTE